MAKKSIVLIIFLILSFSFCSCAVGHKIPDCEKVLLSMTDAEVGIPAGKIYLKNAKKTDDEYFSPSMAEALYGSESLSKITEHWIDLALFLPFGDSPCEFAVALCDTRSAANDTAKLFSSRLSSIKTQKKSENNKDMLEKARVCVIGNVAMLIISSDSENALEIAKKALK